MPESITLESLEAKRAYIDAALAERLPPPGDEPRIIHEAMHYASLGGGKRLRPMLSLGVAEVAGAPDSDVIDAALSVEIIHTASLVLDDLPSMDNASVRRGRPSVHSKYGEATAVLAAMGLVSLAYKLASRPSSRHDPERQCRATGVLAQAMSTDGIIGGQHVDLDLYDQAVSLEELTQVYMRKAGALFLAALSMPAYLLGLEDADIQALERYGGELGLAFQITDDLIDIHESDAERQRTNFSTHLGPEGAKQKARGLIASAVEELDRFEDRATLLRAIAGLVADRVS